MLLAHEVAFHGGEIVVISGIIRNAGYDGLVEYLREKDLEELADNYVHFSYLLSQVSVNLHLDKIDEYINSIIPNPEHQLFKVFKDFGYKCISDSRLEKDKYNRVRLYDICESKIYILYDLKPLYKNVSTSPIKITIQDPNIDSIEIIISTLDLSELDSHTAKIEFAIDHFPTKTSILDYLKDFYAYTLFFKSHRHGSFIYSKDITYYEDHIDYGNYTFYVKDTRRQSKAIRIYTKPIDGQKVLRMELVANQPFIKNNGLNFSNLDKLDTSIITDLISFKQFSREKYFKHEVRIRRKRTGKMIRSAMNMPLYLRQLQCLSDWDILSIDPQKGALMNHVAYLRLLENKRAKRLGKKPQSINKYFYDLEECNKIFCDLISGKSFL